MENKTERPVYDLPRIPDDQPMNETDWYKFLKSQENTPTTFTMALIRYRPGFCLGVHCIPEGVRHNYKLIMDHFWWLKVRGLEL